MNLPALPLASALLLLAPAAASAGPAAPQVQVPWSRPAAAGTTGAGYFTLANPGPRPAVLVKVESPAAERVEMHASTLTAGVMRMEPETRVTAPAGGQVVFAPGGRHLMFVGLKHALAPGDTLPATLVFADGRRVKTGFAVGDGLGPPRPPEAHGAARPHS